MATQSSISSETLDLMMRRVAWVCDAHRMASGLPSDLTDFLAALGQDRLLAMDFWAVVGGKNIGLSSPSKRDLSLLSKSAHAPGHEMHEPVLEAIVRVLTGVGVTDMISAGGQDRQAIEDLKSLLAGRDTQSIATDGRGSLIGSAWSDIPSTQRVEANLSDQEQKKTASAADQLSPTRDQDGNDIRRVLFGEESLECGEATDSSESDVMKLLKQAASWIEPRQLLRVVASALLLVAISALMIRLYNTGALHSYAGSLHQMWSGFGTAEDASNGDANTAKGATQLMKSRRISGRHQQKARPADPQNESVEEAVQSKSPDTSKTDTAKTDTAKTDTAKTDTTKTEADSNPVVAKLPVAYETAPDASTAAHAVPAQAVPIEVSPEVMKANLITPAGPASSLATGLAQGSSRVVMQVVISKSGVVESLRATEGDSALRAAATRAVSAWRYHPYLLNGMPVAVRTTVTVNFRMDS